MLIVDELVRLGIRLEMVSFSIRLKMVSLGIRLEMVKILGYGWSSLGLEMVKLSIRVTHVGNFCSIMSTTVPWSSP